jgi:hypothetical protein
LDRDVKMVARDVVDGVVSKEMARKIYGVVLDRRGELNARATDRLRVSRCKERLKGALSGKKALEERSHGEVSYPPREVVEVCEENGGKVARCAKCTGDLGELGEDWKKGCRVKRLSPAEAGPLMKELVGHYLLQQFYCPSCGALLQNDLVEKKGKRSVRGGMKPDLRRATPKTATTRSG